MAIYKEKKEVCYKCRWLVVNPGGFFRRKSKNGPCDKCLGQMTTFQQADQNRIWIRYIPPKPKTETTKELKKPEDQKQKGAT